MVIVAECGREQLCPEQVTATQWSVKTLLASGSYHLTNNSCFH